MDTSAQPPPFVRSLEHLLDFVDTASTGLHWVGADGTILWANPADYEPLGYRADEYIGHNISEFHADGEVIADILARLTAGERIHAYEARLRCKDGAIRHVQITSSVLFEEGDGGRRFVHTRCYTQDVTERKRIEQARDRFVSILGHDLRNPLNAITMAAVQLRRSPSLRDVDARMVERITRSAERMSRMVTDLIEFARGLGARMPLRRELTNFGEVCHHIVEETRHAYPSVDLQTHSEGELSGYWDRDRVAQAVSNLVVNAVQHGSPPVRVMVRDGGDAIVLEVTNRGLPIAREALSDLFEPFSRTTGTDGLGLGLFIVSEIVGAHGGTIDVQSDADSTRFVSRWPRGGGQQ